MPAADDDPMITDLVKAPPDDPDRDTAALEGLRRRLDAPTDLPAGIVRAARCSVAAGHPTPCGDHHHTHHRPHLWTWTDEARTGWHVVDDGTDPLPPRTRWCDGGTPGGTR